MISVTIFRSELLDNRACEEGMEVFEKLAELQGNSDSVHIPEWTVTHYIWALRAYPAFTCWCRNIGLIPNMSLSGANLSGANLSGANLFGANLSGAYHPSSDLPGWKCVNGFLKKE